jgi:hypothetical protein
MLGHLYDRALGGERCWIRHEDGEIRVLPAHRWLGARCLSNGGPADAPDEVFDEAVTAIGIRARWVRLESTCDIGPWFRWASVGADSAATLAGQVGLTLTSVRLIGGRVIASLAAP